MINTNAEEEETYDLSKVLKNRMLTLGFDYVLIIEWLFEHDARTGFSLYEWLSGKLPTAKVEYVRCRTPAELKARLQQAGRDVAVRGTPIVHIEAHGEASVSGQSPMGFFGPDGDGGGERLGWEQLGDILRPLNIATRFNLLVVGAACFSEGLLLGVSGGKPMPFVAVVGYTDKVSEQSLKHSLLELYRGLLLGKAELGVAVEAADREHHSPDDAVLRPTSMVVLLAQSFIQGMAIKVERLRAQFPLESTAPSRSGLADLSPQTRHILRRGLAEAWSLMWMTKEIPENARRFAIDADRLLELAIECADMH